MNGVGELHSTISKSLWIPFIQLSNFILQSAKKLWKLLIDKDMKKKELEQQAKVSHYTVSKMYRGENVTIDILERICKTLDCSLDDIVEFIPDEENVKET